MWVISFIKVLNPGPLFGLFFSLTFFTFLFLLLNFFIIIDDLSSSGSLACWGTLRSCFGIRCFLSSSSLSFGVNLCSSSTSQSGTPVYLR